MKRRLLLVLAIVTVLVGLVAVPSLAGEPERCQVETRTFQIAVLNTYIHNFVVDINLCEGTIRVTGSTPVDSGYYTTETITGLLAGGIISFHSTYDGPYSPGYTWNGSFPVGGGALGGDYTGTVDPPVVSGSQYRNHGQFVSEMGGGPEAAHSCVGKPVQACH